MTAVVHTCPRNTHPRATAYCGTCHVKTTPTCGHCGDELAHRAHTCRP